METFWNSDIKYLGSTMTKIMCIWGKSPPETWGKSLPGGVLPHAGGRLAPFVNKQYKYVQ